MGCHGHPRGGPRPLRPVARPCRAVRPRRLPGRRRARLDRERERALGLLGGDGGDVHRSRARGGAVKGTSKMPPSFGSMGPSVPCSALTARGGSATAGFPLSSTTKPCSRTGWPWTGGSIATSRTRANRGSGSGTSACGACPSDRGWSPARSRLRAEAFTGTRPRRWPRRPRAQTGGTNR